MVDWGDWRHVTKLDPDKDLDPDDIAAVCGSGTDAVMLGGTRGVTEEKMRSLLGAVRDHGVAVVVEPSNPLNVIHGDAPLFVPTVLNAGDPAWIVGMHAEWSRIDDDIDWDAVVPEGYIVLNPDSAVGEVTDARCGLSPEEAASYATVADSYLELPVVYVEYSGTFGDPEVVEAVADAVDDAALFYGGGIDDAEKAATMARHADTVIVGDAVYEAGVEALEATVRGANDDDRVD